MRKLAALLVPVVAAAAAATATRATVTRPSSARELACGRERWPEKTLSDPFASKVKLTPKSATVDGLTKLTKVVGIGGQRGLGAERTVFRVHARLVGIKQEADSDFHLVIADPDTGATMIAEFPNKSCTLGATAKLRTRVENARVAVVDLCGFAANSHYRKLKGTATVTGVGFFDFIHGQIGHAANGIELHPVLKFTGTCTRA